MTFPGKLEGTVGKLVYDLHHDPASHGVASITATSIQEFHVAAHLDAIESQILPMLSQGTHVLLDRYWWSTWVYGVVTGGNREALRHLIEAERSVWRIQPAIGILIRRETPLGDDVDDVPMWRALRAEYDSLAEREGVHHAVRTVTNEGDLEASVNAILGLLRGVGIQ
jgi:thymidylate kinase